MAGLISPNEVLKAQRRIDGYINKTPVFASARLNDFLGGHEIFFKMENFQKVGAFKARGAFNKLLALKESGSLPEKCVIVSSGNHAQAASLACKTLGVDAEVYMSQSVSDIKKQATKSYGCKLVISKDRGRSEALAAKECKNGAMLIHPYDDDMIIAGQGTACFEALEETGEVDAIFAPCGGGGLLGGTYIAAQLFKDRFTELPKVIGAEPKAGNDASISLKQGKIHRFTKDPDTIADGARTWYTTPRTFAYLQKLEKMIEIEDQDTIYWTQWLSHLLKAAIEPTAALSMAACHQWLSKQNSGKGSGGKKRALIIISGGNISTDSHQKIWRHDHLTKTPAL